MRKNAWCPVCQTTTSYQVDVDSREIVFDEIGARYNRKTARCIQCGNVINVPSIVDENVTARIEALRDAGIPR